MLCSCGAKVAVPNRIPPRLQAWQAQPTEPQAADPGRNARYGANGGSSVQLAKSIPHGGIVGVRIGSGQRGREGAHKVLGAGRHTKGKQEPRGLQLGQMRELSE